MTKKCHRDEDPFKFRKENSNLYPEVSKLAKKYLSIVATSVPCERLFSEAGNITSKKRSSLSPDRVNNLLFLNSYYKSTRTSDHTLVRTYILILIQDNIKIIMNLFSRIQLSGLNTFKEKSKRVNINYKNVKQM